MLGLRTLEMLAAIIIIILNYKHLHHHHHPNLRYNHLSHLERVIKISQLILNVNYLYFIGCVFVDTIFYPKPQAPCVGIQNFWDCTQALPRPHSLCSQYRPPVLSTALSNQSHPLLCSVPEPSSPSGDLLGHRPGPAWTPAHGHNMLQQEDKAKPAKIKGSRGDVLRKPGISFQESPPREAPQDGLNFCSYKL